MMKKYNKLVRDKIPEICKSNGEKAIYEVLGDDEYYEALKCKLIEEINEFIVSDSIEELADVAEVIDSILKYKNISFNELISVKNAKKNSNGSFEKRFLLKAVIQK